MYRRLAAILVFTLTGVALKAQNSISGKITTIDNMPAATVNIELKGFNKNCITNQEGNFEIRNIADGKYDLIVSFVGLQTQQKAIELSSHASVVINFVLNENA